MPWLRHQINAWYLVSVYALIADRGVPYCDHILIVFHGSERSRHSLYLLMKGI
jgi:hypothetical protein